MCVCVCVWSGGLGFGGYVSQFLDCTLVLPPAVRGFRPPPGEGGGLILPGALILPVPPLSLPLSLARSRSLSLPLALWRQLTRGLSEAPPAPAPARANIFVFFSLFLQELMKSSCH
ncbi:unnamed protein product [Gadus morhua 'NCC']